MSKLIIPFVIISIFSFTGVAIYLQLKTSVELSSTLITAFFSFCCSELWMLSSIKKTKIKNQFIDDPELNKDYIYVNSYNRGVEDTLKKAKEIMKRGNYNG